MAANQPLAPQAQPPPDLPSMPDVGTTLTQYLRNFSLWCRNGFAAKVDNGMALPGVMLQGYDAPAGAAPKVYNFEVSQAGVAALAPVALGSGALGAPVPIGSGAYLPLVGVTSGSNAAAGQVGEVISSNVASPGVTLTNVTPANVTSISLTAGDWDVSGEVILVLGAGGSTGIVGCISPTSAVFPTAGVNSSRAQILAALTSVNAMALRTCRVNLSAPATYYLVAQANFSSGTCTAYGSLIARRAR